jgi:hypothetical protein
MPDFNIANLTNQPFNVAINVLIERTNMPELPRPDLGASANRLRRCRHHPHQQRVGRPGRRRLASNMPGKHERSTDD